MDDIALLPVSRLQSHPVLAAPTIALPALIAAAGERAGIRFLEFFVAAIRNPYTRRAYSRAVADFLLWCEHHAGAFKIVGC